MSEIRPGQQVLVAALPIPMNGLHLLGDAVERIYGTGETTVDFSRGDSIAISAPKAGFGKRKTSRRPKPDDVDPDAKLRSSHVNDDELILTLEEAQDTVLIFSTALRQWFDLSGGINYVTAKVLPPDGRHEPEYHVTVQLASGLSAHELRQQAEARVAALEEQLRAAGIEPVAA